MLTDFVVQPAKDTGAKTCADAFNQGASKIQAHIDELADSPGCWGVDKDGMYWRDTEPFYSIANWTSSFPVGLALLVWSRNQTDDLLEQVLRLEPSYRRKITEYGADTMHDLGFLYSLYSVALYKLTGEKTHRDTGLLAAERLAARSFSPGGYIQAWGRMDEVNPHFAGLAIIDCMMNLPLLYWAAEESADRHFYNVALAHAEVTRRHFVRPDGSVCHAFRFDPASGRPVRPDNVCGYNVDSHWARGAAWAIYGFALSFSYTREAAHLETALLLADKFISQLDDEVVPLWDFRLPSGAEPLRDSSAAAIVACGLGELLRHVPDRVDLRLARKALINRLCSEDYLNRDDSHPGLLRNGQVNGKAPGSAVNVYTSWGDYFFMEALARDLGFETSFW
jgi:unsaturated chondroitin disaccharide hydrolase